MFVGMNLLRDFFLTIWSVADLVLGNNTLKRMSLYKESCTYIVLLNTSYVHCSQVLLYLNKQQSNNQRHEDFLRFPPLATDH